MSQVSFAARIVDWQRHHGRHNLPWQQSRDPYQVWLSEIMLQQTQVTTVLDYYERFLKRFPNVTDLAHASVDEVFSLWAGLGYYARARHLHACARTVVEQCDGQFPPNALNLQRLPGIGPSTAAAIASFCYGERAAILDGNVKRVLTRHFAIDQDIVKTATTQTLWSIAREQLPDTKLIEHQPDAMARYTQGMMDVGATVCTRRKPRCHECPVNQTCLAYRHDDPERFPIKTRKTREKPVRDMGLLWLTIGDHVLLEKRPDTGVWGGLWCLPTDLEISTRLGLGEPLVMASFAHELTHFRMIITPWYLHNAATTVLPTVASHQHWVPQSALNDYGLPKPVRVLLGGGKV